jgi:predicted nucleic-acid-binding protein
MKSAVAMLAVDTNIVVRYLVKDDAVQSARATSSRAKRQGN